jgi:hypothetical protein
MSYSYVAGSMDILLVRKVALENSDFFEGYVNFTGSI